jgi:hypothetical protein
LSRYSYAFNNAINYLICCDSVSIGFIAEHDSMPQHIIHNRTNIIRRYMIPAIKPGVGTGTFVKAKSAARAGSDLNPFS